MRKLRLRKNCALQKIAYLGNSGAIAQTHVLTAAKLTFLPSYSNVFIELGQWVETMEVDFSETNSRK